jgi:hypothetical protein
MQLSDMRASVLDKADEAQGGGFITNTTLDRFINQACRFVYNKLSTKAPDSLWVEGTIGNGGVFDTVAGQEGYALPATMKKLVLVQFRQQGSTNVNDYRPMDKINIGNDYGNTYFPIREGYYPNFGYFLSKDKIYLRNVPAQVINIRMWFIQQFVAVVTDTDVPMFDADYHELACELAALHCLGKSGEQLFAERFKLYELELGMMEDSAVNRDQQAEQMAITDRQDVGRYGR